MTINFDDRTIYSSIAKIRDAKDASGKDIFTSNERADYFFDFLVVGETENARNVAKLLIKVKNHESIKSPNLALVGELETEKNQNSIAYRVVNKKYLVDGAIA